VIYVDSGRGHTVNRKLATILLGNVTFLSVIAARGDDAPVFPDFGASDPIVLGWMVGSPPPADKLIRFEGSLAFGMAAGSPANLPNSTTQNSTAAVPSWLHGVWTREWIQKGKTQSNTLDVHYLQTPTYFADIRIPKERGRFPKANSFADLTDWELRLLARQNGFTGLTTTFGAVATWNHDIQFQPSDGTPDRGRLQQNGPGRMHEHGLDGSYIEAWKSTSSGEGRFLVIRVERAGRLVKTLVVAGNQFIYVRNRAVDLPIAESFEVLIDSSKASRAQIEAYLDCEFSVGRVQGGSVPWEIEQSTLPWREGGHLDFAGTIMPAEGGLGLAPRSAGDDQWTVPVNTLSAPAIEEMFGGK
jgi:hypothetical protein